MALKIEQTKRVFEFEKNKKKISLQDPNPSMEISEVSDFYSSNYPELLNCSYEQNIKDGELIITFKSIAGTKG